MANFPFIGEYAIRIPSEIPVIPVANKFYCQLDGKITAVKVIAWGAFGRACKSPMRALLLQTPNGTVEVESCKVNLFRSAEECIEFINTHRYELIHQLQTRTSESVLGALGYEMRHDEVVVYEWDAKRCCTWLHSTGAKVWSDVDGIHVKVRMGNEEYGWKFYKTSAECTAASAVILDFDDEDIPEPKGEYTIKREFTVKARTQAEAESIVDNATKDIK